LSFTLTTHRLAIHCGDIQPAFATAAKIQGVRKSKALRSVTEIYHHKWLFVANDYTGFSVGESRNRSIAWMGLENVDKSRIGRKGYWIEHVAPLLDSRPISADELEPAIISVTEAQDRKGIDYEKYKPAAPASERRSKGADAELHEDRDTRVHLLALRACISGGTYHPLVLSHFLELSLVSMTTPPSALGTDGSSDSPGMA